MGSIETSQLVNIVELRYTVSDLDLFGDQLVVLHLLFLTDPQCPQVFLYFPHYHSRLVHQFYQFTAFLRRENMVGFITIINDVIISVSIITIINDVIGLTGASVVDIIVESGGTIDIDIIGTTLFLLMSLTGIIIGIPPHNDHITIHTICEIVTHLVIQLLILDKGLSFISGDQWLTIQIHISDSQFDGIFIVVLSLSSSSILPSTEC